jgi:hypothetical protein
MLNSDRDKAQVTRREPWEIEGDRPKAPLISRLRGAVDILYLHGFLTLDENAEVNMRINEWNTERVRIAERRHADTRAEGNTEVNS